MTVENDLAESYKQLMNVSRQLLQSSHYEAAFHALQAALHCAGDLKEEQCLIDVQCEAEKQRSFIDNRSPEHRMSTQSAQRRAGINLYDNLIRQAKVHINQIKHEHRQKRLGSLPNVWNR